MSASVEKHGIWVSKRDEAWVEALEWSIAQDHPGLSPRDLRKKAVRTMRALKRRGA